MAPPKPEKPAPMESEEGEEAPPAEEEPAEVPELEQVMAAGEADVTSFNEPVKFSTQESLLKIPRLAV